MTAKRNKKHKQRKTAAETSFFNSKAAFVAGIVVILTIIKDAVGLIVSIPLWANLIMLVIVLILFYLALAEKTLDKKLSSKGVENFGSFLTVLSIVVFSLENTLIAECSDVELEWSITNGRFANFILFTLLGLVGIGGAIYLLCSKYEEN